MSKTKKCCGTDRHTPFCPICGKAVNQNPLVSLLAHLEKTAERYEEEVKYHQEQLGEGGGSKRHLWDRRKQDVAERWRGWADAVTEILNKEPTP